MYIITIFRWKSKLAAFLVIITLFIGLGWGINCYFSPEDEATSAHGEQDLQKDVMGQPVQVQGEANNDESNVINKEKTDSKSVEPEQKSAEPDSKTN